MLRHAQHDMVEWLLPSFFQRLHQQLLRHIRVRFAFGGAGDLSHEPLDDGLFASEELFHFLGIVAQDFFDGFLNKSCI